MTELLINKSDPQMDDEVYIFPMSFAQQRLWFLDQIMPNSPFYNIPVAVALKGRLNIKILEQTLNEIIRRHETLRTTFASVDSEPVQVIHPRLHIPVSTIDLRTLPEIERETEAKRLTEEESKRPFNLNHGPLLRALLIQLYENQYIFLVNMHHIISDGWSIRVFIREIAEIYRAFASGQPSPLAELKIQYADFAQWQRTRLQGDAMEKQLNYWRTQLADSPAVLELPTDHPRPAISTNQGATHSSVLPKPLMEKLNALSQQSRTTLFMTLLAAFQVLLYRYTHQEDICIGTPIANRNQSAIEDLIGFFVNTLVMRTRINDQASFQDTLQQVRQTSLEAFAHQDIPFDTIVEALKPDRDMSYTPLFQVMFILQNTPIQAVEFTDFSIQPVPTHSGTSTFDLTLSITEGINGANASIEYSTDLFDARTIQQMLIHFEVLLQEIVKNPDSPIFRLPLLSEIEKQQILNDWNNTHRDYNLNLCVHQLIEEQAQQTPDAIAVVIPAQESQPRLQLTYRELNQHSNQLAHYLRKIEIGPGHICGICMERSLEMIVSVLGVLKSGAAYLPLDPLHPKDRLAYVIEDSGISILLTQQNLKETLPDTSVPFLCVDSEWETTAGDGSNIDNPNLLTSAQDPVYMIYTSGSTGRSKGVVIQHINLLNAFLAWQDAYQLQTIQTHLQMANFAFDVFSGDFVRALCSGGCLVLCPRDWLLAPKNLYDLIQSENIECAEFVPAVLRSLIQYLEEENQQLDGFKLLICGSDIWYVEEYKKFLKFCAKDTRLINSFGLTEATIDSCFFEGSTLDLPSDQVVPIGRPFANMQMYILDSHLQLVPIGVPGELFVGGFGVAQGYHHRPDLNNERFIPDPFRQDANARLYKTGDLAKYRPDGNIEFLGRLDYQVKIRGFRIETGEIEAVIRQHPSIQDAVVIAASSPNQKDSVSSTKRLAAYLVSRTSIDRIPYQNRVLARNIELQSLQMHPETSVELLAKDISIHGIHLVDIPESWSVQHEIQLRLTLPGQTIDTELTGTIVWIFNQEAGLEFKPVESQETALLQSIKYVLETSGVFLTDSPNTDFRIQVQHPCTIESSDGVQHQFSTENVSLGGICIQTDNGYLKQKESVRIKLSSNPDSCWFNGQIWRHNNQKICVRFEPLQGQKEKLADHLELIFKEQHLSLTKLRTYLKEKLPDYMIPSAFILLDKLPLTSNGKVDRKSLPTPDWSQRDLETDYIPPATPTQELLVNLWVQLLGVERIGISDNFFELGGHSLLATQLVSRIKETFKVKLPLRAVFEMPTITALSQKIEILQRSGSSTSEQPIQRIDRTKQMPLSFAEQRLWFLDQLEPNSPFYNLPESFRIQGKLNIEVLQKCLNEVIRRHEILRTTYITLEGIPSRKIAAPKPFPLPVVDISSLPTALQQQAILDRAKEEVLKPFNLIEGPLLRGKLIKLSEDEHVILFTLHHIIGDDWSSKILIREISALYPAFAAGQPSPLPDLPIQYADFAAWQRSWLTGEVLSNQLDFWKQQLDHLPALLELPTDHPRPPLQSFNGSFFSFHLPPDLSASLRSLSLSSNATLFMTLLAAFQVLLFRFSSQDDIAVGSPIANRSRPEIEPLIGFFINTLVLRADLSSQPSFLDFLAQVRETCLNAFAHQDLPFEMLVDLLHPDRNLSHSPLFQVMFVLQNTPSSPLSLPDFSLSPLEVHSGTAKFDLTLFMLDEGDHLSGAFEFNSDLFLTSSIQRFSAHFQTLLSSICSDPSLPVSRLSLLSPSERDLLLLRWNDSSFDFPSHLCAHQLFELQAALSPDSPALISDSFSLSFRQLNEQANQLAHFLISLGVGPDSLVGICLQRSPEMLIGLLAILKAGGAYLPIDPLSPIDRFSFILEDAHLSILLTSSSVQSSLLSSAALPPLTQVLVLDAHPLFFSASPVSNPSSSVSPDHLAYVIYTSGSTGRPKGAMILHRGLVNYLSWCRQVYPVSQGCGTPLHTSFTFDLSITSLFATLLSGSPVHLLSEQLGVEALGAVLQQAPFFSLVKITPAHLQLLAQQVSPALAPSCSHSFIIGGENLLAEHVAFWLHYAPLTALINEYGPTETVVGCCVYWIPPGKLSSRIIPIGRPIFNTSLYVLDAYLQPVPIGVPGELFIGGVGVARGYLNRPELTAEKFLPDPFSDLPDARMYRTGDLVRYLPDGNLECLGRIDFQLKIRGYRVEPGEIESLLCQHPAVQDAVVWFSEHNGLKQLAAYLVLRDPAATVDPADFKAFLRRDLPDYMIPVWFIPLQALPLSPSGKVNRKALPAPDFELAASPASSQPPSSPNELLLAQAWQQVLGIPSIGVHDNFFQLGGDSILAIQLIARARQLGLFLSPRQIFEHPTISAQAAAASSAPLIRADQGPVHGPLPLTPIQAWFFDQNVPEPNHYNQSLMLDLEQPLESPLLQITLRQLMMHHDALRLTYEKVDGQWQQINQSEILDLPLTWIHLSNLAPGEQTETIESISALMQKKLNLFNGPLLRMVYFDLGPNQPHRLLLILHHLAVDGVSWRILLDDFQNIYQQIKTRKNPDLPPKTTSFKDWAIELKKFAQSPTVLNQADYWLKVPQTNYSPLPLDFSQGCNYEASSASLSVKLTADETFLLLHEVPTAYHTEIMDILLTALAQAVQHWTGNSSVLLNLEGHGREEFSQELDVSRTVGWFTSLYPVWLTYKPDQNLGEAIMAVKEQLRSIPDHGLGYGLLRYITDDPTLRAQMNALPNPEISFNYLGQFGSTGEGTAVIHLAQESRGLERCPYGKRNFLVDINGGIANGQLGFEWTYSNNLHKRQTIQMVADDFIQSLKTLIAHCCSSEAGGYTPSDVSEFGWGQTELDEIMNAFKEFEEEDY